MPSAGENTPALTRYHHLSLTVCDVDRSVAWYRDILGFQFAFTEEHPDGSGLMKRFEDASGRFASHPTWSPDGSMIIFALNPVADDFEHRPNGLYVIDATQLGVRRRLQDQRHR